MSTKHTLIPFFIRKTRTPFLFIYPTCHLHSSTTIFVSLSLSNSLISAFPLQELNVFVFLISLLPGSVKTELNLWLGVGRRPLASYGGGGSFFRRRPRWEVRRVDFLGFLVWVFYSPTFWAIFLSFLSVFARPASKEHFSGKLCGGQRRLHSSPSILGPCKPLASCEVDFSPKASSFKLGFVHE